MPKSLTTNQHSVAVRAVRLRRRDIRGRKYRLSRTEHGIPSTPISSAGTLCRSFAMPSLEQWCGITCGTITSAFRRPLRKGTTSASIVGRITGPTVQAANGVTAISAVGIEHGQRMIGFFKSLGVGMALLFDFSGALRL